MKPILTTHNLCKNFGNRRVHEDINLELREGEVLGLLGGSGTGKSTLLRMLSGLEEPDMGDIKLKSESILALNEPKRIELRKTIAYVFQGGALFDSLTVEENLAFPLEIHTQLKEAEIKYRVHEILKLMQLEDSINLYPAELSGGMQKRAGLARSIILEPEIILYDEPTAGLDPFTTKRIQDIILNRRARGSSGILVTHDITTALVVCDRLALLKDQRLIGPFKTAEVAKDRTIQSFIMGEIA